LSIGFLAKVMQFVFQMVDYIRCDFITDECEKIKV